MNTSDILHFCPKCEPDGLAEQNYPVYIPGVCKSDIKIQRITFFFKFVNIPLKLAYYGIVSMSTFLHNCLGAGLQGEGTSYSTIDSVNTVITDLGRLLLFFSAWLLIRFILVLKIESKFSR